MKRVSKHLGIYLLILAVCANMLAVFPAAVFAEDGSGTNSGADKVASESADPTDESTETNTSSVTKNERSGSAQTDAAQEKKGQKADPKDDETSTPSVADTLPEAQIKPDKDLQEDNNSNPALFFSRPGNCTITIKGDNGYSKTLKQSDSGELKIPKGIYTITITADEGYKIQNVWSIYDKVKGYDHPGRLESSVTFTEDFSQNSSSDLWDGIIINTVEFKTKDNVFYNIKGDSYLVARIEKKIGDGKYETIIPQGYDRYKGIYVCLSDGQHAFRLDPGEYRISLRIDPEVENQYGYSPFLFDYIPSSDKANEYNENPGYIGISKTWDDVIIDDSSSYSYDINVYRYFRLLFSGTGKAKITLSRLNTPDHIIETKTVDIDNKETTVAFTNYNDREEYQLTITPINCTLQNIKGENIPNNGDSYAFIVDPEKMRNYDKRFPYPYQYYLTSPESENKNIEAYGTGDLLITIDHKGQITEKRITLSGKKKLDYLTLPVGESKITFTPINSEINSLDVKRNDDRIAGYSGYSDADSPDDSPLRTPISYRIYREEGDKLSFNISLSSLTKKIHLKGYGKIRIQLFSDDMLAKSKIYEYELNGADKTISLPLSKGANTIILSPVNSNIVKLTGTDANGLSLLNYQYSGDTSEYGKTKSVYINQGDDNVDVQNIDLQLEQPIARLGLSSSSTMYINGKAFSVSPCTSSLNLPLKIGENTIKFTPPEGDKLYLTKLHFADESTKTIDYNEGTTETQEYTIKYDGSTKMHCPIEIYTKRYNKFQIKPFGAGKIKLTNKRTRHTDELQITRKSNPTKWIYTFNGELTNKRQLDIEDKNFDDYSVEFIPQYGWNIRGYKLSASYNNNNRADFNDNLALKNARNYQKIDSIRDYLFTYVGQGLHYGFDEKHITKDHEKLSSSGYDVLNVYFEPINNGKSDLKVDISTEGEVSNSTIPAFTGFRKKYYYVINIHDLNTFIDLINSAGKASSNFLDFIIYDNNKYSVSEKKRSDLKGTPDPDNIKLSPEMKNVFNFETELKNSSESGTNIRIKLSLKPEYEKPIPENTTGKIYIPMTSPSKEKVSEILANTRNIYERTTCSIGSYNSRSDIIEQESSSNNKKVKIQRSVSRKQSKSKAILQTSHIKRRIPVQPGDQASIFAEATNSLMISSSNLTLKGKKILKGDKLKDQQFKFELLDSRDPSAKPIDEAYNDKNGIIKFKQLQFTSDDLFDSEGTPHKNITKRYYVREVIPKDTKGINYETRLIPVNVKIGYDDNNVFSASVDKVNGYDFTVVNSTGTTTTPVSKYLHVTKKWDDKNATKRPTAVQVQLYRDGEAYESPVTLNDSNNWTHIWENLDNGHIWTVNELNVPEGYTKSITTDINQMEWTITNTKKPDKPDKPNKPDKPDKPSKPDKPNKPSTHKETKKTVKKHTSKRKVTSNIKSNTSVQRIKKHLVRTGDANMPIAVGGIMVLGIAGALVLIRRKKQ